MRDYSVGFRRWIGRLLAVAACSLLLQVGSARGDLILRVSYQGNDFDFFKMGTSGTLSDAELLGLNSALTGVFGANFEFTSLAGTSTSPDGNPGVLTVDGAIRSLGAIASDEVDVFVTSTDYDPGGPLNAPISLNSSASDTFTLAPDDVNFTEFTSYFNPSNTEFATDVPSPLITLVSQNDPGQDVNSQSDTAPLTPLSGLGGATYGLTNLTSIFISTPGSGTVIDFQGTTTVNVAVIPEPASLALVAGALPLAVLALRRRRA